MIHNLALAANMSEVRRRMAFHGAVFLNWWFNELAGLVPIRLRRLVGGEQIIVVAEADRVAIHVGNSRTEPTILRGARADAATLQPAIADLLLKRKSLWRERGAIVLVPPDRYLRRRLTLPLAVRAHLTDAIRYQLSRISPFQNGDVAFASRIMSEHPDTKTLVAEVAIITNQDIADLHELTTTMGQGVERLVFGDLDDVTQGQALSLQSSTVQTSARLRRADYGLLAFATCLGIAGLVLTHANAVRQGEMLETQIQRLKPLADKAAQISRQIEGESALATKVADAKTKSMSQITVLNILAQIFGDDVRLSEYRTTGSSVVVTGYADDATRLLSLIDANKEFRATKFVAPVTRDQAHDLDRFSVTFELGKRS